MIKNKLIVLKYGGSSVSTKEKIIKIAQQIKSLYINGNKILVVISAMGKFTDELLSIAYNISKDPLSRELDVILTTGERISMALLSIALNDINIPAISFTGSQAGIITDCSHTKAKIVNIKPFRIINELDNNKVVIVAGFQGVSTKKNITTLGRGGSDLTAIALSIYLNADQCIINTDVDGIYPIDPTIIKNVKPFKKLTLSQASLLSSLGAKVMHDRACVLASRYKRDYYVRSTFNTNGGTMITNNHINNDINYKNSNNNKINNNNNFNSKNTGNIKDNVNTQTTSELTINENLIIKAITSKNNIVKIQFPKVSNLDDILSLFTKYNINIDYFFSSNTNYYIFLNKKEFDKNIKILKNNNINKSKKTFFVIHIIGEGLNFFPGFVNKINKILLKNSIKHELMFFQGQVASIFVDSITYNLEETIKIFYNNLKEYLQN